MRKTPAWLQRLHGITIDVDSEAVKGLNLTKDSGEIRSKSAALKHYGYTQWGINKNSFIVTTPQGFKSALKHYFNNELDAALRMGMNRRSGIPAKLVSMSKAEHERVIDRATGHYSGSMNIPTLFILGMKNTNDGVSIQVNERISIDGLVEVLDIIKTWIPCHG